jgi:hypothetical protein
MTSPKRDDVAHPAFDPSEDEQRHGDVTICPYCGYGNRDSWENNNNQDPNERDCGECGETFVQWADVSVTYCAKKLATRKKET